MTIKNEQTITITLDKKDRENLIEILDYINQLEIESWLQETNGRLLKRLKRKTAQLKEKPIRRAK